jgi:hypothetical protein
MGKDKDIAPEVHAVPSLTNEEPSCFSKLRSQGIHPANDTED